MPHHLHRDVGGLLVSGGCVGLDCCEQLLSYQSRILNRHSLRREKESKSPNHLVCCLGFHVGQVEAETVVRRLKQGIIGSKCTLANYLYYRSRLVLR